jgi:hypothetical protein
VSKRLVAEIVTCNGSGRLLNHDETRGNTPPDVLGGLLLKVAVERFYSTGEGGTVVF